MILLLYHNFLPYHNFFCMCFYSFIRKVFDYCSNLQDSF